MRRTPAAQGGASAKHEVRAGAERKGQPRERAAGETLRLPFAWFSAPRGTEDEQKTMEGST